MATTNLGQITKAANLEPEDAVLLKELVNVYGQYRQRNALLTRYYEGKVKARDVNIGIAVPEDLANLDIACSWPAKVVEALQSRSQFDAFWSDMGEVKADFDEIIRENDLLMRYNNACIDELKHGVVFGTLSMGEDERAHIKFHNASSSAGMWDGEHDRVLAGFAIVDTAKYNCDRSYKPSLVNMYTQDNIIVLRRVDATRWVAEYHPHPMGRPLMVAMPYRPSFDKPFGRSRISPAVMHLTDAYLREFLRLEVGAELFTSPQKALIGADDALTDKLAGNFAAYITNILTISPGENGEKPELMQLAASSMTPHIEVMRCLAANLSGCSDVPISELGIIHDNPSSAEAIFAAQEPLVVECEQLNRSNGKALKELALMAYAMNNSMSYSEIPEDHMSVIPHFRSPAMPSVVSQADAMTKIAAVDDGFAGTTAFYSQVGFDDATIEQIQAEKAGNIGESFIKLLADRVSVKRDADDNAPTDR